MAQGPAITVRFPGPIWVFSHRDHRIVRMELFVDQFVGFCDRHYLIYSFAYLDVAAG